MFDKVLDSGQRREFNTGSRRDSAEGKGRFDLLPIFVLRRLAVHYENGAKKYGDHNWRKGQPISVYISSAFRHFIKGILNWQDEDHWVALIWNACAIIETLEFIKRGKLPKELDDRYDGYLDDYDFFELNMYPTVYDFDTTKNNPMVARCKAEKRKNLVKYDQYLGIQREQK